MIEPGGFIDVGESETNEVVMKQLNKEYTHIYTSSLTTKQARHLALMLWNKAESIERKLKTNEG